MVHNLTNRKRLEKIIDKLISHGNIPLVNWPLVEGAILIEFEIKSAKGKSKFMWIE